MFARAVLISGENKPFASHAKPCHGKVLSPTNSRNLSKAKTDNAMTIETKKMTAIDLFETSRECDSVLVFAGKIRFAHHDSKMMGPTTSIEMARGAMSMALFFLFGFGLVCPFVRSLFQIGAGI